MDVKVFPGRIRTEIPGLVDSVPRGRRAFVIQLLRDMSAHAEDNQ